MLLEVVASTDTLVGPEDGTGGERSGEKQLTTQSGPDSGGGGLGSEEGNGARSPNSKLFCDDDAFGSGVSQMLLLASDQPPRYPPSD